MINKKEILKIKKFINENPKYYNNLINVNLDNRVFYGFSSEINQIICHLEMIELTNTDYYQFYKIIKKHFNLKNKKILEVASGPIPILSSIIKENEKTEITAVNEKILYKNYKGVKTKEKDLTKPYVLKKYDLIIGFRPCIISENIINLSMHYKKDFCIYLCSCPLKPKNENGIWGQRKWHNYLINIILQNKNYNLKIIKSKKLLDDCPVLIAKYKKL